ncbi:hypothetical protein NPIL_496801 [Nephila pilipes]|uniref:Uncharacterized protein n=1 Tax=Nephila pilipes TaxID=299642 RepID=A0A8X6QEY1_NEPPI|nr:hypothetical protein NPIL_205291 [Nephila pilipes]GFU14987.1 hypothetical protein NPIL_496801 [Nephila pilipes]
MQAGRMRPYGMGLIESESQFIFMWGRAYRSPATKNYAPQATAVCGCGERQPAEVQWQASAREILLLDQG